MAKQDELVAGSGLSEEGGELFVDFDAIEDYEAVPQGMYPTSIIDAKLDVIRSGNNTGKPKLVTTMAITSEPYVGRKLFRNYALIPSSLWALKRLMKAIGLEGAGKVSFDELPGMLVGSDVAVSVTHRTYQGEIRSNVQNVFPIASLDAGDDDVAALFGTD
jgi:hypothetical protein